MDLLELNDIYCKDKARIKTDEFFKDPVRVEYSFTPTEEHVMSTEDGRISAIVNNPFDGIRSVTLNHSIKEFVKCIHDGVPVTDHLFGCDADVCVGSLFENYEDRVRQYNDQVAIGCQCHPDITFSNVIPGMTLILDRMKNTNFELSPDKGSDAITAYSVNGIQADGRALSLIYISKDNNKIYGYGGTIYTNRGLKSLDDALKIYLFSNTYIVSRSPEMEKFPEFKTMKTSCVIIYEDSLERVLKLIDEQE
jgi:hypothetical protein